MILYLSTRTGGDMIPQPSPCAEFAAKFCPPNISGKMARQKSAAYSELRHSIKKIQEVVCYANIL